MWGGSELGLGGPGEQPRAPRPPPRPTCAQTCASVQWAWHDVQECLVGESGLLVNKIPDFDLVRLLQYLIVCQVGARCAAGCWLEGPGGMGRRVGGFLCVGGESFGRCQVNAWVGVLAVSGVQDWTVVPGKGMPCSAMHPPAMLWGACCQGTESPIACPRVALQHCFLLPTWCLVVLRWAQML